MDSGLSESWRFCEVDVVLILEEQLKSFHMDISPTFRYGLCHGIEKVCFLLFT